jgi:hypothetical protein
MIALRPAVSVAALSASLWALPAGAQVTPQEVWSNWEALFQLGEQEVTIGSIDSTPERVFVSDMVMSAYADDLIVTLTMPSMEFLAGPGGTVDVRLPDVYTMTMSDSFEEVRLVFEFRQPGTRLTASGSLDALTYDFASPEITFELVDFQVPDNGRGAATAVFAGRVVNSSGRYLFASDGSIFTSTGTMDSFAMSFDVVAQSDQGHLRGNLLFTDATSTLEMRNLHLLEEDPMMGLMMGLSFGMGLSMGSAEMDFDFRDGVEEARMTYSSVDMSTELGFSRDGALLDVRGSNVAFSGLVPDFPFPVEVGMAESAVRIEIPMTLENAPPRQFTLLHRLVDLTVNDDLYSLIDPVGAFPRTPITAILDITGVGIMNVMEVMMGIPPGGVLESMSLNELRVSFGGAELTGSGAFTFDMTDLVSFDGIPAPVGTVRLALSGGNAFLDAVGRLGMFGPEELMGIRMGLGMFGRPVGPDQIESVIELTPGGGLAVNGMRLQ